MPTSDLLIFRLPADDLIGQESVENVIGGYSMAVFAPHLLTDQLNYISQTSKRLQGRINSEVGRLDDGKPGFSSRVRTSESWIDAGPPLEH